MTLSWSSSFAEGRTALARVSLCLVLLAQAPAAQAPSRAAGSGSQGAQAPAVAGEPLLGQAVSDESGFRFDAALDRLYELVIEHPGTDDAVAARLRLARLLALTGSVPQALRQCQLLRDETPADHPARREALELATLLSRRFRAAQSTMAPYFSVYEAIAARGLPSIDEPSDVVFESDTRAVLLDQGAKRVFRLDPDSAVAGAAPQDPTAIAFLRDGPLVIAGKTGLWTGPAASPVVLGGTWGGKARQAKKVRSMAAASDGSLFVIDRDFDGVLRCEPGTGRCAPWGPAGEYRVVRIGPAGWVFLLDERGQYVRVVDASGRALAAVGPVFDGMKFGRIESMALDRAHGFYLLDTSLKRIYVCHLKASADGKIGASLSGWVPVPQEGDRATKNPAAIGVAPTGWVLVAGKSQARVMRFR